MNTYDFEITLILKTIRVQNFLRNIFIKQLYIFHTPIRPFREYDFHSETRCPVLPSRQVFFSYINRVMKTMDIQSLIRRLEYQDSNPGSSLFESRM